MEKEMRNSPIYKILQTIDYDQHHLSFDQFVKGLYDLIQQEAPEIYELWLKDNQEIPDCQPAGESCGGMPDEQENMLKNLVIRTDFRQSKKLTRAPRKKAVVVLSQVSQVHEFVIQLLLFREYKIRGINFVVTDPSRLVIEVQLQIFWWDKLFNGWAWKLKCLEMSRLVSSLMPIGLCTIKPI